MERQATDPRAAAEHARAVIPSAGPLAHPDTAGAVKRGSEGGGAVWGRHEGRGTHAIDACGTVALEGAGRQDAVGGGGGCELHALGAPPRLPHSMLPGPGSTLAVHQRAQRELRERVRACGGCMRAVLVHGVCPCDRKCSPSGMVDI